MNFAHILAFGLAFLIAFILHEMAHGIAAKQSGDPTASLAGRITFNPIKHLSLYGSFIIPLILIIAKAPFLLIAGKPVPVDFKLIKYHSGYKGLNKVALAGVKVNFLLGLFLSIPMYFIPYKDIFIINFMFIFIGVNLLFALFNLIPIPPLDGGKLLLFYLEKKGYKNAYNFMLNFDSLIGFVLLLGLMFFGLGKLISLPVLLYINLLSPEFVNSIFSHL